VGVIREKVLIAHFLIIFIVKEYMFIAFNNKTMKRRTNNIIP